MHSEKLGLEHKILLGERLKKVTNHLSEYSYANLYLFRNKHDYELIFDGEIFIKGKTYDGSTFLMPTWNIEEKDLALINHYLKSVDFLFPVPDEWLKLFPNSSYQAAFLEADTDYVYTVEKMATFKGRKLSKKRNLLKQFLETYQPSALKFTTEHIQDAIFVLDRWQEDVETPKEETDYFPCREALEIYEKLDLCGITYYVDQEPAGFILAEKLNDETLALHFAKGRKKFKGLYQYMYNTFARILSPRYKYLNFEQDLGQLALKIAKSSYIPDQLLKKYRVKPT